MNESKLDSKNNTSISQQESDITITLNSIEDIDNTINTLLTNLSVKSQDMDQDIQIEISNFFTLFRRIKKFTASTKFNKNKPIQDEVYTIMKNLVLAYDMLQNNNNLTLATNIRIDAERALHYLETPLIGNILTVFHGFLSNSSTALKILIGLALALPMYLSIPAILFVALEQASSDLTESALISESKEARDEDIPSIYVLDFKEGAWLMTLAFTSGSTGSVISILSRVGEYNKPEHKHENTASILPIFIGLFKPIIGGVFGIFVYGVMNTVLLNDLLDQKRTDSKWFTVISITFVVGFSERLAQDMIGQIEDKMKTDRSSDS